MRDAIFKLYLMIQNLERNEEGQDLIEYALVSALIAVSAISGMKHIASAVASLFSNISSSLA